MENDNEKHSRRDFLRELLQGSFVAGAGLFLGSKLNIAQAMGIGGGVCSSSYECAGGGGNCGSSYSCAGQGKMWFKLQLLRPGQPAQWQRCLRLIV